MRDFGHPSMIDKAISNTLGKRILELRKERGWSQPDLGRRVGTSGAIVGRYERAEITPSVDVARKLAEALGVTLDYLTNDKAMPQALKDPRMLERWRSLDDLLPEDRDTILFVVDSLIRDAQTRRAYGET